jgi:hypothetical protein
LRQQIDESRRSKEFDAGIAAIEAEVRTVKVQLRQFRGVLRDFEAAERPPTPLN